MPRTRFRRKDLKRPDKFVSRGRQLLVWVGENRRRVTQVAAGIAVVAVLVTGFFSVRGARARQANEDLSRGLVELHNGNYSQAATHLADVASRWGATAPGRIATLYAASADIRASNFETAALLLQDVVAEPQWPPYLRQQALTNLAFALERKGDLAAAAGRYAEASGVQGPYTALAIVGEARCREGLGDKEAARKLYERLTREFPQASENELISAKMAELAG
jgi:tetratricopeptide (TPR) repeat protein